MILFRLSSRAMPLLAGLLLALPPPSLAQPDAPPIAKRVAPDSPVAKRFTKQVANGVQIIQEILPVGSRSKGPLVVTALRVDLKAPNVRVEAALGQDQVWGTDPTLGREVVSALTARHEAVAGINGGYFPFAGNPIGLHIQNGDLVTEPNHRSVLALLEGGDACLATFTYAGRAHAAEGTTYPINGLNRRPGKGNELLLFTPRFFRATLKSPGRAEVVLQGVPAPLIAGKTYEATVALATQGGSTPLVPDTVVLSGGGTAAEWLRTHATPGAKLTFRLEAASSSKEVRAAEIRAAIAGGPRLLTDGRITVRASEEGFKPDFVRVWHPRTAAGLTRDGALLLVAVDGRQRTLSRGVSLPELATILLKLGAINAINLDGGGSTALVVRDAVANSPSGGRERAVANALLIYADTRPAAPKLPLTLTAPTGPLVVGQSFAFALRDASGRVLTSHPEAIWGTAGGIGFAAQDGGFRALRAGKGTVHVALGKERLSAPVTVIEAAPLTPSLTIQSDDKKRPDRSLLIVRLRDRAGDPAAAEPITVSVTGGVPDAGVGVTDRRGEARIAISWSVPPGQGRSIRVSSPRGRFAPATLNQSPGDS